MKQIIRSLALSLSVILLALGTLSGQPKVTQTLPISAMAAGMEWTGGVVSDPDYSIWGCSPILGSDGKVHVFAARWPQKNVDPGWRISSEVAHYVADKPEGPYRFVDVAVKGTGQDTWDKYGPHNPEVKKIGKYYVIVYIANDNYNAPVHPGNQKIGLVYAESLNGPWKKVGGTGLIVEASLKPGHWTFGSPLGVDNPCITEIDGKIVVYFKAKKQGVQKAIYGYAIADHIEGPYTVSDDPITDNDSYLEDATCFSYGSKHYLLTTDNFGEVTGIKGGGILWQSETGFKFSLADAQVGYKRIPDYNEAYDADKVTKIYGGDPKFERPKVLFINDQPAYFFAPSGWNVLGGERSIGYILKIK